MRQAVVLIHGIGEQRPMQTLRAFVSAVLGPGETFWSKPDRMAETFELRRLTSRRGSGRPVTDFYEYYWAHYLRGTRYGHVARWLATLLFRRPSRVPVNLRGAWYTSWTLLAVILLLSLNNAVPETWSALVGTSRVLWVVAAAAFLAVQTIVLQYVGDAARYLSPHPDNIASRQRIRANAVRLLRRLHRARYDRIIVVGHSLGSVIAYDALKQFWHECHTRFGDVDKPQQEALRALESWAREAGEGRAPTEVPFATLQASLWREQLALGSTWRVTNFVTIGSPLAHAELLLAKDAEDLASLRAMRELPTCPPALERGLVSFRRDFERPDGTKRTIFLLHHAALFACTSWTNLYFPCRLLAHGDLVGGPVAPVFGPGVQDVPVSTSVRGGWLAHTAYWRPAADGRSSLGALRSALDLGGRDWRSRRGRLGGRRTDGGGRATPR